MKEYEDKGLEITDGRKDDVSRVLTNTVPIREGNEGEEPQLRFTFTSDDTATVLTFSLKVDNVQNLIVSFFSDEDGDDENIIGTPFPIEVRKGMYLK